MKKLDRIPTHKPTCEPTPELSTEPTKHKKSRLKLQQKFMNEVTADEKDMNNEIFWNYLSISVNENPNKIANIVEKILNFNRQQKGKGIKNLTPKQML